MNNVVNNIVDFIEKELVEGDWSDYWTGRRELARELILMIERLTRDCMCCGKHIPNNGDFYNSCQQEIKLALYKVQCQADLARNINCQLANKSVIEKLIELINDLESIIKQNSKKESK